MKAIVCKNCNGNNIVKQGELYVCQNCGTNYTADKVNESENYRQLANEARLINNLQKAGEYYNQLAILCPEDWEALFFSVYCSSATCILAQLSAATVAVGNAAKLAATKIAGHIPTTQHEACSHEIAKYVLALGITFRSATQEHYQKFMSVQGSLNEAKARYRAIRQMLMDTATAIIPCNGGHDAVELLTAAFSMEIFDCYAENDIKFEIAKQMNTLKPDSGTALMESYLHEKFESSAQKKSFLGKLFGGANKSNQVIADRMKRDIEKLKANT